MLLVTSIAIGVLGAVARFQAAAEVAGFKMHALGVALMVFAVAGLLVSFRGTTHRVTARAQQGLLLRRVNSA
jgi:hypothetical protein